MPKMNLLSVIFILISSEIFAPATSRILENGQNVTIDQLCTVESGCICDYKIRDCSKSNSFLPLRPLVQTVNSTTELFHVNNCDSGGLLIIDWLENSFSSLARLSITNCALERVTVKNVSSLLEFDALQEINFSDNRIRHVQFDNLIPLVPNLKKLRLEQNALRNFYNFSQLPLKILDLSQNRFQQIPALPSTLREFNISHNLIEKIKAEDFSHLDKLEILDVSHCRVESIEKNAFAGLINLKRLLLNGNRFGYLPPASFLGLVRTQIIDLSANNLQFFEASSLQHGLINLETLILDGNPIRRIIGLFPTDLVQLTELSIADTQLLYFDTKVISGVRNLRHLILRDNRHMRTCDGSLARDAPALQLLDLSNGDLTQLRRSFFANVTTIEEINLVGNPWACDCRLDQWIDHLNSIPSLDRVAIENLTIICANRSDMAGNGTRLDTAIDSCDIGTSITSGTIQRTTYGSDIILDCGVYGDPDPVIVWEQVITKKSIGQWPLGNQSQDIDDLWPDEQRKHLILPGGLLLVRDTTGQETGPYRCIASNRYGNASALIFLRLDYSNWWEMKLYSVGSGIITAIGFFILNVIYVAIRRMIIWRISQLEQSSRVRLLLEAMEKYRQRQLDSLHEKYAQKMNQIRDNYHGQVDQMRKSYSAQADRFRDYRAAQIETMTHHIDSIRDNYNWQANRVREYGSRQMERLWESYQRQVNRLRAFSLQQRLRLMRQYKINQRYWNKMFESINIETNGPQNKDRIRVVMHPEMIELPDLPPAVDEDDLERPGPSNGHLRSNLIDEFDDAVSTLMMKKAIPFADDDDMDGSSYHSIPGEELEPLEAEILSQIEIDTEKAMQDDDDQHIPPIIAGRR